MMEYHKSGKTVVLLHLFFCKQRTFIWWERRKLVYMFHCIATEKNTTYLRLVREKETCIYVPLYCDWDNIPSSGVREGNSYICSTVLRLRQHTFIWCERGKLVYMFHCIATEKNTTYLHLVWEKETCIYVPLYCDWDNIPSSGVREGNSYICSTVLRLRRIQHTFIWCERRKLVYMFHCIATETTYLHLVWERETRIYVPLYYDWEEYNIPSSGEREGNSYICSTVLRLRGMQNPNSKSKLFNNLSLKKCLSIIRNLFTALSPTTNSTLKIWQKSSLYREYPGEVVNYFLSWKYDRKN